MTLAAGGRPDPSFGAMAPVASSSEPQSDEPRYLSVIDLFVRVAACFFAVFGVAVAIDVVRDEGVVFRSWGSFAVQAAAAFLLSAFVARQTLATWRRASRRFVPANIVAAAAIIGLTLAAGTLAGGFFPDAEGYQRRAPEPFWRFASALLPSAFAVYLVLGSSERKQPLVAASVATASPQEPLLTGEARDAAVQALDMLDAGERELTAFHQRLLSGMAVSDAAAESLWQKLDGKGLVAHLRKLPPTHAIRKALQDAAVAQTDAVYLIALAHGAHNAVGHTAESARAFVDEVASRRGRPGADAATLRDLARDETKRHRDTAAGLLQVSRFAAPARIV